PVGDAGDAAALMLRQCTSSRLALHAGSPARSQLNHHANNLRVTGVVGGDALLLASLALYLFFSSRRQHTRCYRDWSSDVCSSDLITHSHFHRKEPTKNQNDSSYCRGYRNVQDEVLGKMDGHYCQHDYRDYENVERVEPDSKVVKTETENYLSKIRTKHRSVVRKRLPYVNCQLSSDIEDQVISCVRLDYRDDAKNNSGDPENLVAELV